MTTATDMTPAYFTREPGGFLPTRLARSPWSAGALAGGPVSGLMATLIEEAGLDPAMQLVRYTLDILGLVPNTLLEGRVTILRDGRQMQLVQVELIADGKARARATVLRARKAETPAFCEANPYPHPDKFENSLALPGGHMGGAIHTRAVEGGMDQPGRGILWLRMTGEVVAGTTPSPFVSSAIFADFGNGIGASVSSAEWSYANMDVQMQFLRMPRGEWVLVDAQCESAGNGTGTAVNRFADVDGIFAHGFQSLFIAPGGRIG